MLKHLVIIKLMREEAKSGLFRTWRRSLQVPDGYCNRNSMNMSMPNSLGGSRNASMMSLNSLRLLQRSTSVTSVVSFKLPSACMAEEEHDIYEDIEAMAEQTSGVMAL